MAKVIRRRWIGDPGPGVARRDRQSCDYEAYVPDPLTGRTFRYSSETAADVADAERAIATLDAQAAALLDTEAAGPDPAAGRERRVLPDRGPGSGRAATAAGRGGDGTG